ncbi:MAG: hypothetical protein PHI40_03385 [Caldisericia bacterium]|nr:hypothetical protein [Caldisericia bacterium]
MRFGMKKKNVWWYIGFVILLFVAVFFITMSLDCVDLMCFIMQNVPSIFLLLVLILSFHYHKVSSIIAILTGIGLAFLFGFTNLIPLLLTVLPVLVGSILIWFSSVLS